MIYPHQGPIRWRRLDQPRGLAAHHGIFNRQRVSTRACIPRPHHPIQIDNLTTSRITTTNGQTNHPRIHRDAIVEGGGQAPRTSMPPSTSTSSSDWSSSSTSRMPLTSSLRSFTRPHMPTPRIRRSTRRRTSFSCPKRPVGRLCKPKLAIPKSGGFSTKRWTPSSGNRQV